MGKGLLLIVQCAAFADPHHSVYTIAFELPGDSYSLALKADLPPWQPVPYSCFLGSEDRSSLALQAQVSDTVVHNP